MKKYILLVLTMLAATCACAQVSGTVTDGTSGDPLAGATVYWAGTTIGASSNAEGEFSLNRARGYDRLVASHLGFAADTITVSTESTEKITFTLMPQQIEAVTVTASGRGNYTSLEGVYKGENINFSGLTKMACCNLSESFENSAAVTVGYSDAVSGARQIKMLGLAGIYTQILDETRPIMRGLGSPYGLGYTPGMWLESIQVSKGVTSVTGGHEALSGQINLEYRKPAEETPLFLNLYVDNELRGEVNFATSGKVTEKLSTVLLGHGSVHAMAFDHNGDGFMDMPRTRQINFANRWHYQADNGIQLRFGAKYVREARTSGEMDFEPYSDRRVFDLSKPYGSEAGNENLNAYFKMAIPVGDFIYNEEDFSTVRSNFALIADYNFYNTDSYYGLLKEYKGNENSAMLNAMYSWNINTRHKLITGLSGTSDTYREWLLDGMYTGGNVVSNGGRNLNRTENEAGAYAEYSYSYRGMLTLMAGGRADYNNLHGWFFTPRGHIKWNIAPKLVFRGSAGLGYRSANLIADNLWALATGRMLVLPEDSVNTLEKAFTYGGSLTWNFRLGRDNAASLGFDYFRSEMLDQLIADQEYEAGYIRFYNPAKPSVTDTYQIDFNWTPATGFDIFLTFRYNRTEVTLDRPGGGTMTVEKPLTDQYKGVLNLQYATRFRRWVFDFTAQVNGPSRIPVPGGTSALTPMDSQYSPVYPLFFAQVTWRANTRTSIYLGCENILNYTQHNPYISPDAPYSPDFNASLIWGPLMGRKIYAGARFNF